MNDEILERLAALYTSGKPFPLTVTIRGGKEIATRLFLESYRYDRRPAPFVTVKQSGGPSLMRDQPLISEVVAVLLLRTNQPAEHVDVLPSFDHCDTRVDCSRNYIFECLAKYRAGGNQLPKTLKVGVSEIIRAATLSPFGATRDTLRKASRHTQT